MPQLRVSDFTYRYIKDQKMAGESFDDVLTRLLDIEPDLGELTAYMADEQADIFNECVMTVEEAVDVTREMEETQYDVSLNMDATDSGETLISFVVSEKPTTSNVEVYYRTLQDELRQVGAVAHQNAIETIDPITAGEELPDRHEEIITDCREIVKALENRLQSDRRTLEEASLPEELAYQRDRIDKISSESLSEIDDISRFAEEWSMMVSLLTERLESIADTVSVIESYEAVADRIEKTLLDSERVTPDELAITSAERALQIYAHRHSDVRFDSSDSALHRI